MRFLSFTLLILPRVANTQETNINLVLSHLGMIPSDPYYSAHSTPLSQQHTKSRGTLSKNKHGALGNRNQAAFTYQEQSSSEIRFQILLNDHWQSLSILKCGALCTCKEKSFSTHTSFMKDNTARWLLSLLWNFVYIKHFHPHWKYHYAFFFFKVLHWNVVKAKEKLSVP